MRLLYEQELKPHLADSKDEIEAYAKQLIDSDNANNWQRVNELSYLLRRNNRNDESVSVSKMMFEKDPSVDKLNLFFVSVVDQGSIEQISSMSQLVDDYLKKNNLPYQKHLFATWLKAANRIQDDQMFHYVYSMIPSEEKTQNSYIISQYYVNLNRHSQYNTVKEHYEKLPPNVQNAKYVQKYYLNACARMGYSSEIKVSSPSNMQTIKAKTYDNTSTNLDEKKKIFIVYGGTPVELATLKALLGVSGIDYIDLAEAAGNGKTIIEEFEAQAEHSGFALVLVTPEVESTTGIFYAKQNVIFECGYFVARLGRENVRLLYATKDKNLELPSDISGTRYISLDRGDWLTKLGNDLRSAGFTPAF